MGGWVGGERGWQRAKCVQSSVACRETQSQRGWRADRGWGSPEKIESREMVWVPNEHLKGGDEPNLKAPGIHREEDRETERQQDKAEGRGQKAD